MCRARSAVFLVLCCLGPSAAWASDVPATRSSAGEVETRKLPGGAILRLAPGTRISLGRPIKVQLGSRPESTLAQSVQLLSGRVEIDLPPSKTPTTAVLIQAPQRVSAVAKGGHSVVIATPNHATVAALSGEMLVAAGNDWRTLASGLVRDFVQGSPAGDHSVLPAPQASVSTPVALSWGDEANSVALNAGTTVVPRAASYEFGLWQFQGGSQKLLRRLSSREASIPLGALPAGSYGVSAHAVETSGLEGAESELVLLRIVSAKLPNGAKFTSDGILLPPNQRVSLLGTEGVEISYGRAPQFVPAPNTIGLIRGEPTLVRLRASGSREELSLTLAPSTLHADVQIGPARAQWPGDPVQVTVRLSDSCGRPLTSDVEVKPTVFVNVTPVKVDFKREGAWLTGTIAAADGPGPWVVRVEVPDATGNIVGRNFLEIAPTPPPAKK
jgi:hypothetical protein